MVTVRIYQSPERAYIEAGYLCSLGLNACVSQDPAFSGMLFGAVETPYRLQVAEFFVEQLGDSIEHDAGLNVLEPSPRAF